jgi:hypothetical protein
VPTANPTRLTVAAKRVIFNAMGDRCRLILFVVAGLFRSRAALLAENLVLRHQLNVLRRKSRKRLVRGSAWDVDADRRPSPRMVM